MQPDQNMPASRIGDGPTPQQIEAGQAVYSRRVLSNYDWFVLGISNRFVWRCPSRRIAQLYARHVSSNHLDVGVGSGYFLDRCDFPAPAPRLALMDLNPNALAFCAHRLARYAPEVHRCNVLQPIAIDVEPFDSVALSYLLHCLPGALESKAVVFDHLQPLLRPGAVVFGATLLHDDASRGWLATRLMNLYNARGIFSNREDTLQRLELALTQRFSAVSVERVGCAALFSARASRGHAAGPFS